MVNEHASDFERIAFYHLLESAFQKWGEFQEAAVIGQEREEVAWSSLRWLLRSPRLVTPLGVLLFLVLGGWVLNEQTRLRGCWSCHLAATKTESETTGRPFVCSEDCTERASLESTENAYRCLGFGCRFIITSQDSWWWIQPCPFVHSTVDIIGECEPRRFYGWLGSLVPFLLGYR